MGDPIRTIQIGRHKIEIFQDDNPENPRDGARCSTMVCWHRRYQLGDEQPKQSPQEYLDEMANDFIDKSINATGHKELASVRHARVQDWAYNRKGWEKIVNHIIEERRNRALDENIISLPLYLYDHSGITMKTSPFSCPWDSGKVGFIYIYLHTAKAMYGDRTAPDVLDECTKEFLRSEVALYDRYLRGDVYGFRITDLDGDEIDSCWGFYGMDEVRQAAMDSVEYYRAKEPEFPCVNELQG